MSRFDVVQGELGDCWVLAAVANLTLYSELIDRVIPATPAQSFDKKEYVGAFRFYFWRFGKWEEVVVDDYLPTYHNRLVYMHSGTRDEFWSALLEKAYAKLVGCYDSLRGGSTCESMTDLTGGFTEVFELKSRAPPQLFQIMEKATERESLMCCSINQTSGMAAETKLSNGLIMGHAYSVTDAKRVQTRYGAVELVRVRNPWGNSEWKGAYSDSSREWQQISASERQKLGMVVEDDGEFWMSYRDFVGNFETLEICNLSLDYVGELTSKSLPMHSRHMKKKKKWETTIIEGEWRRYANAGGCRNFLKTFWTNPQYRIKLTEVDEQDNLCTVLIGLMQKDRRKLSSSAPSFLTIGFSVYQVFSIFLLQVYKFIFFLFYFQTF